MSNRKHIAFHMRFGNRNQLGLLKELMKAVLKPAGVSMIILELDKNYVFEKHPEIDGGDNALTKEDASRLQDYAHSLGMEIVPLVQCLGHQGWGGSRSALLEAYPEFDETPDVPLDAEWPEIFCRSWCPNHPDVNGVVYDLLEEIIEGFKPNYLHIGMDEVYELASDQCPRCKGKDRAELFSKAVSDMHTYIKEEKNIEVMMWADRLLDAEMFGYDNWEADTFGTYKAIDLIPKDIILLDWHYDEREKGYPTPGYLMKKGFKVMPACWFKKDVAKRLFEEAESDAIQNKIKEKYFGKVVTSWHHWSDQVFEQFITNNFEHNVDQEYIQLYETLTSVNNTK